MSVYALEVTLIQGFVIADIYKRRRIPSRLCGLLVNLRELIQCPRGE
jgi:hypothetical protein